MIDPMFLYTFYTTKEYGHIPITGFGLNEFPKSPLGTGVHGTSGTNLRFFYVTFLSTPLDVLKTRPC